MSPLTSDRIKQQAQAFGFESRDLEHWTDVSASLSLPDGIRHGTAFRVPSADADRLLAPDRR